MNLNKLVSRGKVSITDGQLVLTPISGKPVPGEWLENNQEKIIKAVLEVTGKEPFEYMSHSTQSMARAASHYPPGNSESASIQRFMLSGCDPAFLFRLATDSIAAWARSGRGYSGWILMQMERPSIRPFNR